MIHTAADKVHFFQEEIKNVYLGNSSSALKYKRMNLN